VGRDVIPRFTHLVYASGELPRAREHGFEFEFVEIFAGVPRGWDRRSALKRKIRVVLIDEHDCGGGPLWSPVLRRGRLRTTGGHGVPPLQNGTCCLAFGIEERRLHDRRPHLV